MVDTALKGNCKLFVKALLADAYVTDIAVADRLVDELIAAQAQQSPQFA